MQPVPNQELFDTINALGVVDPIALRDAFTEAHKKNLALSELLISKDLISDENIGKVLSDILNIPLIRLAETSIDAKILNIIPEVVAKKQRIIAYEHDKDGIKVAMVNPRNTEIVEFLKKKTGENVTVFFATNRDIENAFHLYKKDLQSSFDDLLAAEVAKAGATADKPVTRIFDLLIEYAYANKTSDIHIEPTPTSSLVRFRIDGVLHDVLNLPKNLHDQIITRIKVLAKLRTDEHLSAQDGKLQIKLPEEELDVRVSIVPVVEGEKSVMRLLSSRSQQFSLSDLGMSQKNLDIVTNGFHKPFGMVLVTGPTGSGKTTTIYAILKILNTRDKNIATIEDPVEYELEGLNQIQVNAKTNLTFAAGLRSILRQDPNIIFVGEIRDNETADIAVNSAMTGHLVLSTLHTNDAATTLPRLLDLGVEPFLVASTVNVIIAQRLVRKICDTCKVSESKTVNDLEKLLSKEILTQHFGNGEIRIYRGKGCDVCHQTGFVGRVALFEVLEVTENIKKLITDRADSNSIHNQAIADGMASIFLDGLEKVKTGVTTIEEVVRVTKI